MNITPGRVSSPNPVVRGTLIVAPDDLGTWIELLGGEVRTLEGYEGTRFYFDPNRLGNKVRIEIPEAIISSEGLEHNDYEGLRLIVQFEGYETKVEPL
jgi:hypothetical protein